ncbi:MAG: IS4 family transposase [Alphaproteobacteria bacterium]|nr:IS4 family transposase [Alphaproteobacteria bacterium]
MNAGQTIFSQLMDFLPTHEFNRCVRRYAGNRRVRQFSCRDQFLCMAFAQLTYRESLRDIETCLRAMSHKLYHAGFRTTVARSTLADANEVRDWRIYADFAAVLIAHARRLYAKDGFGVELKRTVYAFDSTTIDLCLALFPWAQFRRHKSAVKLHTLIDLRGSIPCFVHVSGGKMADVTSLDLVPIEAGSFYVLDRGYTDFGRLYRFTQGSAFFIIRAKRDLDFIRQARREVDKSTGLRSDTTIRLRGPKTSTLYPAPLRRISYYAADIDKRFVFLTNNFTLSPLTIARLYKCRWQVELFFKWIKQYLRIKAFYGTSINAVKTQVWIAVCVYVLVAIVKKELKIDRSMGEILQILSISLFERTPVLQAISHDPLTMESSTVHNQLPLFDF